MPYKDPDQRKAANAARMRRRRAEGQAWIDPAVEAERKARWYAEGGKEKHDAAQRARRQAQRIQGVMSTLRKLKDKS